MPQDAKIIQAKKKVIGLSPKLKPKLKILEPEPVHDPKKIGALLSLPIKASEPKKRIRPPVKIFGGKYYLSGRIIKLFPKHRTYLEPFGGAASVLLNKPPSQVEVYNDIDGRLTRMFRVLRDHGEEFQRSLQLTPYSENEFENALERSDDEIEQARRDFIRWRLSIAGRGDAFSYTLHRGRRGMADVVSGFLSAVDEQLPLIIERLRVVQIVNLPAIEVLRKWDSEDTLAYLDPPYEHSTRNESSRDVYRYEMSDGDHRELASYLRTFKGKVVLSGYPSPLYDSLYAGWRTESFDIANHASGSDTKARKEEKVWLNW